MNLEEILDKPKPTKRDKIFCFLFEALARLHDSKATIKDMEKVKICLNDVWRKHNPI